MAECSSRRLMKDAVIGLGKVELCPSSKLFVTPSHEERGGRKHPDLAPLAVRHRRQRVKDGLLPSAENKGCDGDWPGLAGVPFRDANHAPCEDGVTQVIRNAIRSFPREPDQDSVELGDEPGRVGNESAHLCLAPSVESS